MATRYTVGASRSMIAEGCTVSVYDATTGSLATIYGNVQGTALANPFVWNGGEEGPIFYAPVGNYYATVAGDALSTNQRYRCQVIDKILTGDGTAASPAIAPATDPTTGPYTPSAGHYGIACSGALAFDLSPTGCSCTPGNGAQRVQGVATELVTIAAAATTDTSANLLPANSIIDAVTVRVTTLIPTAATFTVGDATQAARFATGVAVAAGTTAVGLLQNDPTVATGNLGPVQTSAAKIRITPNSSPADATGRVRVTVFYRQFVAPTS
jgi:hypothetical protein